MRIVDLIGYDDGQCWQPSESAASSAGKAENGRLTVEGSWLRPMAVSLAGLPIDPWIVLALIVDAAPRGAGVRDAGEAGVREILGISGKAMAGADQRRPEIGRVERSVGQRVVGADLGMAADDRVGAVGIAFCLGPGPLRIAREQRQVIGLRGVVDGVRIGEVRIVAHQTGQIGQFRDEIARREIFFDDTHDHMVRRPHSGRSRPCGE